MKEKKRTEVKGILIGMVLIVIVLLTLGATYDVIDIRDVFLTKRTFCSTATITVCTDDSGYNCDYVCDGINDQVEIQAAIDTLPSGGGKVMLMGGTYNIHSVINLTSNCWLTGQGDSTILKFENGSTWHLILALNKCHVRLSNMKIDGNKNGTPSGEIAVYMNNVRHFVLEHLWIVNAKKSSINCAYGNTHDGIIHDCLIDNGDHDGIIVTGTETFDDIHNITIRNCKITNHTSRHGINLELGARECIVEGCIAEGNKENFALLEAYRCAFVNCTARESTSWDYRLIGDELKAIGCTSYKAGSDGIYAGMNGKSTSRLLITGCSVVDPAEQLDNRVGIRMDAVDNAIVEGCKVKDTRTTKRMRNSYRETYGTDYITLKNNNFYGSNEEEIYAIGTHNVYDRVFKSTILNLSDAATDVDVFHAIAPCQLVGYAINYTETSSDDAGVAIQIGSYKYGVTLDNDYFGSSISEQNKNKGYVKYFTTDDLTQNVINPGDTVTVGTSGTKTGTGKVKLILQIVEMVD